LQAHGLEFAYRIDPKGLDMDGRRVAMGHLFAGLALLSKGNRAIAQATGAKSHAEIETAYRGSVLYMSVKTSFQGGDSRTTNGVGFVVTPVGHVLTAAHLVGDQSTGVTAFGGLGGRDARFVPLMLVNVHAPIDIALFQFQGDPARYPPVLIRRDGEPRVGDRLVSLSFPPGVGASINIGTRSSESSTMGGWLTDMPLRSGDSGAPVFDEFGQVVAYVSRGSEQEAKYTFVRPIRPALAWLRDNVDFSLLTAPQPLQVTFGPQQIFPLDGHRLVRSEPVASKLPFPGGARLSMTLAHSRLGSASLVVDAMKVRIRRFAHGKDTRFAYLVDGSKVHGQGFVEPDVFRIRVRNGQISSAGWVERAGRFAQVLEGDLMRTDPPRRIRLSPTEDLQTFEGSISVAGSGYYEMDIQIRYLFEGREYTYESEVFAVYGE
jgi:hypothetical protein